MSDWFTLPMFVAFLLGVFLSAMVKSTVGRAKAKVGA